MSMAATGDRINYTLRPAKAVERKMLKDIFSKLYPFGSVSEYKYIGFGSKYFSDFKLFHKTLHIDDMVSIESDIDYAEKYEFNKPFGCVRLELGLSNKVLSRMKYENKFIAWLDYDYAIDMSMLTDIEILIENLFSGSIILSSYNAMAPRITALKEEFRDSIAALEKEFQDKESTHSKLLRRKLKSQVAQEYVPRDIPVQGLAKTEIYSKVVRMIFVNKIKSALLNKNAALDDSEKWECSQIIYFNYRDGADMSTLGWVFYQRKDKDKFEKCEFSLLDFYRNGDSAYKIDIPNLTIKEIRFLQEHMPLADGEIDRKKISDKIYSDEDVVSFSEVYKYFPNFMDIEIA